MQGYSKALRREKGKVFMRPIDDSAKWLDRIISEDASNILTTSERERWNDITNADKISFLADLIDKPIVFENPELIYDWYFRNKWAKALKTIHNEPSVSVFEIGAGGCDIVPKAVANSFCHPDTKYVTANLNKELTRIFKWKTENDPITISVVEDDAANIKQYSGTAAFDAIVFEHSINDVL